MLNLCRRYFFLSTMFVVARCYHISIDKYGRHMSTNDALFLTPFIESGRIEEGRNLSAVTPMLEGIESFAGYLTVNKKTSSNLFFWLFKSQEGKWEEQPLVIWLQGGPGSSSLFGLFTEVGPFSVTENQKLKRREYSWNRKYNLVFIDNPVGAGFSFTKVNSGYARNETDVARDLYKAIVQLYKLFPVLQGNKLIITGESYAGKYIPAIAYKILKMNQVVKTESKINLAGLMIGNGFTDPENMLEYASFVNKLGLIDTNLEYKLMKKEAQTRALIRDGDFKHADSLWNDELEIIQKATGFQYLYNFIDDKSGADGPEEEFINNPKTRKAIHVGRNGYSDGEQALNYLAEDLMQSVKPWVEELLAAEEFPIMFYSGQLDVIVPYALSIDFYNALKWPSSSDYQKAKRCIFKVDGEVAGYFKTAGTFMEVMVRNAGHMVPTSQPKWAFELMDRFITNSTYFFKCQ